MNKHLIQREPSREIISMNDMMNRLFGESFFRPWRGLLTSLGTETPPLNMYEIDGTLVVEASVPGVKPEEIDVQLHSNVLTIKGEHKEEKKEQEASYICQEQNFGSFSRSVTLPYEVETDRAKAEFNNGVLTLTLPKSETAKPRSIKIKTA